jgi:prepilin-type N-terminal cleavage/methylation domain-containing protein
MMCFSRNNPRGRRGLTLSELVIALAIAVVAMVGIAQLMYQATNQYRVVACRNLVAQEAANIMEDLMSRPWSEIASNESPVLELSPACRQAVPHARLQVEIAPEQDIVPEEDHEDARRITVSITWMQYGKEPTEPTQLVAWRYAP